MEKKTMYMIIALVLVLAFLLEQVAVGTLTNTGTPSAAQTTNSTLQSTTGQAYANVTISKYEPYLIVSGDPSLVNAVEQNLTSQGLATYTVQSGGNWIVNLNSSEDVVPAAVQFDEAGANVSATAMIIMPSIVTVTGNNGSVDAQGTSFNIQMDPIYDEESIQSAYFSAEVENGEIVGLGSLTFMPTLVTNASVTAEQLSQSQSTYSIDVPWADRTTARPIVLAANASYQEKSYIDVAMNATQQQLSSAASESYVTATKPGVVSVANDFEAMQNATADLSSLGLSPSFPPSVASFGNQSGNQSALALISSLNSAGINASLSSQSSTTLMLPAYFSTGGKTYYVSAADREIAAGVAGEQNSSNVTVTFNFEANGNRVASIDPTSIQIG